jgi:Ser-tRNA(Ala) deacylase AlaX
MMTDETTTKSQQAQEQQQDSLVSEEGTSESTRLPPTDLLYLTWEGNFQLQCRATVLRCSITNALSDDKNENKPQHDEESIIRLCLDQTVLHAQGGGQPTDFGTVRVVRDDHSANNTDIIRDDEAAVIQIQQVSLDRTTGVALHTGRLMMPTTTTTSTTSLSSSGWVPNVGDQVQVVVDADRRRILSECHTAGHVVDAAMARCQLYLPPSKAYHYLEGPYVEYQGNLKGDNNELLTNLQQAFRHLVEEDVETKIDLVCRSEAQAMCHPLVASQMLETTKSEQEGEEEVPQQPIRIVTVAGWPCPCGGTHVKSTGELRSRQWNITGIKCKKGVVRVKYHYQVR